MRPKCYTVKMSLFYVDFDCFCAGSMCEDPGTPIGAIQVVDSYEIGQVLTYKCDRDGFFPYPPDALACELDGSNAVWNSSTERICKGKFLCCVNHPQVKCA